jgi:hypothetical protein
MRLRPLYSLTFFRSCTPLFEVQNRYTVCPWGAAVAAVMRDSFCVECTRLFVVRMLRQQAVWPVAVSVHVCGLCVPATGCRNGISNSYLFRIHNWIEGTSEAAVWVDHCEMVPSRCPVSAGVCCACAFVVCALLSHPPRPPLLPVRILVHAQVIKESFREKWFAQCPEVRLSSHMQQ